MAGSGHNSGLNKKVLISIIDRIERLEAEKSGLSEDIKDIYTEAKEKNYDVKVIRHIISLRRKDREKLREFNDLADQYIFLIDPELADVLS